MFFSVFGVKELIQDQSLSDGRLTDELAPCSVHRAFMSESVTVCHRVSPCVTGDCEGLSGSVRVCPGLSGSVRATGEDTLSQMLSLCCCEDVGQFVDLLASGADVAKRKVKKKLISTWMLENLNHAPTKRITPEICVFFKRRRVENTNCLSSMRGVMIRCTESKKLVRLHNINVTF